MITETIEWLKEYGDVLGGIGSIMALTMLMITNGRVIMQRLKGGAVAHQTNTKLHTPDYGGKTAIAIMPFKALGDVDPHFGEGLITDLIADIRTVGFAVASPEIAQAPSKAEADIAKIAVKLGAQYALATHIRQQEGARRVSAQLIDTSGAVVWSQRFDASGTNVIDIQETVAEKIAAAVSLETAPENLPSVSSAPTVELSLKTQTDARHAGASPKSRFIAFLLCLVVGIFGAHRYYVGRPYTGVLYTLTLGLISIGWLLDLTLILVGMFADGKGRPIRFWAPDTSNAEISHAS